MPTVRELTALYENFMITPQPGPSVCTRCFNLTDGFDRCYACQQIPTVLDAVAPISYSVGGEQLHHALASYKRCNGEVARRFAIELAAVLWRHLEGHERCIAGTARTERFALVTTVPSSDRGRDEHHPLRQIVATLVAPTRARHIRLLRRSTLPLAQHQFDPQKYEASRMLDGEAVLLVDDTWTTGANAQSAATALKTAGAGRVAAVVIGRHVNRGWHENHARLRRLGPTFDWQRCALCADPLPGRSDNTLGAS